MKLGSNFDGNDDEMIEGNDDGMSEGGRGKLGGEYAKVKGATDAFDIAGQCVID